MPQPEPPRRLELLAPAGDSEALAAALEAGADAVYFGLTTLNARRRARNLRPEELPATMRRVQDHGARAYLTLNTDLSERELGQAARLLEVASRSGVAAVLVRDPALLLLRPLFPQLEFHLSTQAGAANPADVAAAGRLGLTRVVLARELALEEVRAASAVPGVQTEVFVQGALCYCVSGRCLLSSWGGGRSGNRGWCTSPCRVPWRVGDSSPGQVLSMRDLSAVDRLAELASAGVAALKIEGRMKSAAWVRAAVALYRRALDGAPALGLAAEAERLGAYSGRQMTSGYLDGQRAHLTGAAGRGAAEAAPAEEGPVGEAPTSSVAAPAYRLTIAATANGVHCQCECDGQTRAWDLPRTVVRRADRGSTAAALLAELAAADVQGFRFDPAGSTGDAEALLAPRTVRGIRDQLSAVLHQRRRERAVATVRIEIPAAVRACLERSPPAVANSRLLGDPPDRVRLSVGQAADFALRVPGPVLVVEGAAAADVSRLLAAMPAPRLVIALPSVIFAEQWKGVQELVEACRGAGITVEANSWGGGALARDRASTWESGLGLPVLNSLAARYLHGFGASAVTLSAEADRVQLEDICRACPAPASLLVYGRPVLMLTRAALPAACLGQVFEDRRGIRIVPRCESGLIAYRPEQPFSIRQRRNPDIRVAHLVADLVAAPDPVREWQELNRSGEGGFSFNYDRGLS